MKKFLLSLTLTAAIIGSAFATPEKNEPSIIVKTAFTKEFALVKDVKWESIADKGVYQARFTFNDESVAAYFTEDGEFLGTMRLISKSRLPVLAVNELARKYGDMYLVSVYEHSTPSELAYYITLTNAKGGLVLKATGDGEMTVYKRIKQ
jgi:hypothetical protein